MIIDRILKIIELRGINKSRFYKETGLSNGFLDKVKDVGGSKLEHILKAYPEISPEWLLTGKGAMLKASEFDETKEKERLAFERLERIKKYASKIEQGDVLVAETKHTFNFKTSDEVSLPMLPIHAAAGVFTGDVQVMEYECERYVVPMFREATFLIPVLGDSMYPTYNNGDVIACRKLDSWSFFQFGKVYVIYTSQGVLVKRIREGSTEQRLLIVSDNKDEYPSFELDRKEILGVALVIGGLWLE